MKTYVFIYIVKKQEKFHSAKKVATFKPKFDLEAHQRALMVVASE